MPEYRMLEGSPQEEFSHLRTKIQIFGGGFGNGKTAAAVVQKALAVARDYPGCNILIARSTYPKLNDTIRKEFVKWCPQSWIKSFPMSKNSDNTCTLVNGSTINFRYIAQQGKSNDDSGGQTTSNLLSATYDLIIVDQLEDPEIVEKDFNDLLGRLRGNARYIGRDPTMPLTGPRWFIGCVNPTRNWVYRKIIAPYLKYKKTGVVDESLLCERHPRDIDGIHNPLADQPILDNEGNPILLMSLVEGSTYTNKHNLGADFIATLESVYMGQSRDRFLYGEWAAYEGLVHPDFDEQLHCIPREHMLDHFNDIRMQGVIPGFIEGYDFGITEPCCYLIGFTDRYKNVFITDGFYVPEEKFSIQQQQSKIWELRNELGCEDEAIRADPAIFRRTAVQRNSAAKTISQLFKEGDNGVRMVQADNEVLRGITKVNMYLAPAGIHRHPINGGYDAPHIFFATELTFIADEFGSYYWKADTSGKRIDEPIDKKDHSMNVIKYMLSKQPDLALRVEKPKNKSYMHSWSEGRNVSVPQFSRKHRHG